ncbi:hypothetical protein OG21DRAFT_1308971 [Imleria badia]|nr:hypothetical protein OG21DRAFT_1308971 [Imleria badia]
MHPESEFYQISGYRAHSNGWFKEYDDRPTTKELISMKTKLFRPGGRNTPVELVLGILPSGASYLLITSEQMHEFTHKHRLGVRREPWRANDFLSLSPIYFNDVEELSAKIATYKQRARNQNRRDLEKPLDNSQANRGYVGMGPDVVHYRAYFEQQRMLYRLLKRELEPGKVGLAPPPWLGGVRVVSLVIGQWTVDNRRRDERLNDPRLVDVGWTDALFPPFFEQLTGSPVHLELKSPVKMINPGSKDPYFSEIIEDDQAGLYQRLRNLLSHDANTSGIPLIVLVHDEDMARSVLSRAGIALEQWSPGLSNLLPLAPVTRKSRHKVEEAMPSPAVLPGPCIVDMQKLVKAVMQTNPGHTVPHSAKVLHMQTETKTCAGDDSLLQLHMWTSMAQGLAIDEQHKQRSSHHPNIAQVLAPPQAQANADADPNDDDPNDMPPGPLPTVEDDFSDDDDW